MEIASEKPATSCSQESKKRVVFETTPLMSTYLVVMVAGYFNVLETNDFRIPIRAWAALDKDINNTAYALEIAVKAMKTHEEIFGIEYPLPKLDMVAIPGHQGGMEHWGCVTYDERGIILNDNPSESDKMRLAQLITHELAHQWFGNIVTMKWWDSIWLNEAFSEWAMVNALSRMLPEWDFWASFVASDPSSESLGSYQGALELDSNKGSHAILEPNIPPAAAFDSIAYLKGCSIIRMVAEDLGVDVFLQGIRHYLKRHMYGNATTEDLWDALSEISGQDVASAMADWTQTVGYPLLTVHELRPNKQIVVTQSRFFQNGDDDAEMKAYPVKIHLRSPDGVKTHLMSRSKITIPTNLFEHKLNADQVGFYRVSYSLSRIQSLGAQFASGFLSVKDKVGIISDLGATVTTGAPNRRTRISDLLEFLFAIKDRVTDLFVWREMLRQLQKIQAAFLFEGDDTAEILKSARFELLSCLIRKDSLEFKPEDTLEQTFLNVLLFSQLKDYPLAQKEAGRAWDKLLDSDKDALNPNIRKIIFETVLLLDDTDETWNNLKSIAFERAYIRPTDPVTPLEALYALGSSPNSEHIARAVKIITPSSSASPSPFSASPDTSNRAAPSVPSWNTRLGILKSLIQHAGGAQASWNWLRENWDALRPGRGKGDTLISYLSLAALGGLATRQHLAQVEEFFTDKVDESFELLLTQAMDVIRARARFVGADHGCLLAWARQRGFPKRVD